MLGNAKRRGGGGGDNAGGRRRGVHFHARTKCSWERDGQRASLSRAHIIDRTASAGVCKRTHALQFDGKRPTATHQMPRRARIGALHECALHSAPHEHTGHNAASGRGTRLADACTSPRTCVRFYDTARRCAALLVSSSRALLKRGAQLIAAARSTAHMGACKPLRIAHTGHGTCHLAVLP